MAEPSALANFAARLPPRGSLLGLDLSKRRIGLAGTDVERRLVTPLAVLQRRRLAADLPQLAAMAAAREVVGLVAGLPLMADGRFGPAAQAARDTAVAIAAALGLPLHLQDERWTTVEAHDRGGDDAVAAALILEDALRAMAALR